MDLNGPEGEPPQTQLNMRHCGPALYAPPRDTQRRIDKLPISQSNNSIYELLTLLTHFFDYTIVKSTIQFEFRIVGISRIKKWLVLSSNGRERFFFILRTGRGHRLCGDYARIISLTVNIIVLFNELIVEHSRLVPQIFLLKARL